MIAQIVLAGVGLVLLASPSWAAQYCVQSTDRQEAAITWTVEQVNAAAQNTNPAATPETNDTYVKARVKDLLRDYVRQHQAVTVDNALKSDVEAATDAKKTKIRNVLTCDKVVCP